MFGSCSNRPSIVTSPRWFGLLAENHPRRQLFHLLHPLPEVLGEPFLGIEERHRSACGWCGPRRQPGNAPMSVVENRITSCYRAGLFALEEKVVTHRLCPWTSVRCCEPPMKSKRRSHCMHSATACTLPQSEYAVVGCPRTT